MKKLIERTTITQAINDFDSIKAGIESHAISIPFNTPTSEYEALIKSIQTGGTPPIDVLVAVAGDNFEKGQAAMGIVDITEQNSMIVDMDNPILQTIEIANLSPRWGFGFIRNTVSKGQMATLDITFRN